MEKEYCITETPDGKILIYQAEKKRPVVGKTDDTFEPGAKVIAIFPGDSEEAGFCRLMSSLDSFSHHGGNFMRLLEKVVEAARKGR